MDLKKYVQKGGRGTIADLVRESGISRTTVEKAVGGMAVSAETAKAISAATGGKVSARKLVGV
jgi:DNA-binding transcriptional regulator YdaS (Cro superfamily)|tara:strand:+ start:1137 stop:1325 length:189 start_codon:yes stop_codon:yes gene_type:complete